MRRGENKLSTSIDGVHTFDMVPRLRRVTVRVGRCLRSESLLQHVSVRWLDTFVVARLAFDDLEAEFLVELYGTVVVDLNVPAKKEWLR